jgi:hypothetical protein
MIGTLLVAVGAVAAAVVGAALVGCIGDCRQSYGSVRPRRPSFPERNQHEAYRARLLDASLKPIKVVNRIDIEAQPLSVARSDCSANAEPSGS